MTQLSYPQLESLWIQAGGAPHLAPEMAAIAEAESSGRSDALNDNPGTGDFSVGPWQINYYGSLMDSRTQRYGTPQALIASPILDARAAVDLAGPYGEGLSNWSTWKSGAYEKYMQPGAFDKKPSGGGGGINWFGNPFGKGGILNPNDSVLNPVHDVKSIWDSIANPIESAILRGVFILGGLFVALLGVFLLARAFGVSAPKLPVMAAAEGYVAGRAGGRSAARRSAPRRKGDAAIGRGEEVTRTGPPEHTTNVERRRAAVLKSNRERAERASQRAKDKEYGDVPF